MANVPVPVDKASLLSVLDDIRAHVEADDSFEGSFEYTMPFDEDMEIVPDADFMLRAAYRVGNSQGQGGMRMVGTIE